jgi:hypothetical protein
MPVRLRRCSMKAAAIRSDPARLSPKKSVDWVFQPWT